MSTNPAPAERMTETEPEHTPGPWLQEDGCVYALGPAGTNIFCVSPQRPGPEKCSEAELAANARLMAASPDLLAALAGITGACVEPFCSHAKYGTPGRHLGFGCRLCNHDCAGANPDMLVHDSDCPTIPARAALARATGGAQ